MIYQSSPIFICFLSCVSLLFGQVGPIGQIEGNPFKLENSPKIKKIELTSINSWLAGSLNSPEIGKIKFTATGFKGEKIPHLSPNAFKYYLKKNGQEWPLKANTIFHSGKYEANLKYPRVSHLGPYQIGIKLNSSLGETTFLSETKLLYQKDKINIIFILDNSGSMVVNDPHNSRLQAVLNLPKDRKFSRMINKIGVVIFGDNAKVLIPMTAFQHLRRHSKKIASLSPRGKTDVPGGLKVAYKELMHHLGDGMTVAVLLTDGVSSTPSVDVHRLFKQAGVPIFTIGLEVKNSSEGFNPDYLKKIAQKTGGTYFRGGTQFLDSIYKKIATSRFNSRDQLTIILPKKKYRKDEYLTLYVKWLKKAPFDILIKVDEISTIPLKKIKSGNWHQFYLKPLKIGRRKLDISIESKKKTERHLTYLIEVIDQDLPFSWKAQSEAIKLIPYQLIKEAVVLHHQKNTHGYYHLESMHFIDQQTLLPTEVIKFIPAFHLLNPGETKVLSIAYEYQQEIAAGMYSGNILIESDEGIFGFEREIIVEHSGFASIAKQNLEITQTKPLNLKVFILILIIWLSFGIYLFYHFKKKTRVFPNGG